ncbi:MAG: DUF3843 family protein [Lewinellaceae bacterium]|nr:DUF3843 family protein [Lewinellaceae bacterium]
MKRRTRKKPGQPKVVIQDWMALRPYDAHSDYDLHYLRIANKIYERIFNSGYPGSYIPEAPDPAMLACIIASYYEDYVCEIGIWKAFTSRNKELYGYYLPFYESEQYDPGYINPEDISYLLWHFWGKWNDTFFAPDWELFTTLGRKIYDYLEPMLDNALGTDFYERFFTVKGDEDFFDVKERLKWFAEGSYLFATDLYFDRKEKIEEALGDETMNTWSEDPGKYLYMVLEEYIYRRRCSFSALTAPEFFARVCRCSEPVRKDIAGLKARHWGTFECLEEEEQHFLFSNIQTGREYKVRKDSFQQFDSLDVEDKLGMFALVPWRGEWWMTGAAAFYGRSKKGIRELRKQMLTSPFLRTEEQLQKAQEAIAEQYQVFMEQFGGPLATFTTRRAANDGIRQFYKAHREKILAEKPEYQENAPQPLEGNMIGDIPEAGGIGVFFNREEGIIIVGGILDVIQLMEQKEPLNREAAEGLFEALTNYDPALVKYLLDNYPTHNVSIPIEGCETNLMKYIWFVNRYQRPDDFGEVFPNITMMDRELWEEKRS